jgi:DNA invertase Pin-like site-specific DNA recombinase
MREILLLQRQRGKGKSGRDYKGRKPTARDKAADVVTLDADGLQRTEVAERLGIGAASVYRALADAGMAAGSQHVA